jgi:hypothetical protein
VSIPPEITSLRIDPSVIGFQFRVGVDDVEDDLLGGRIVVEGAGPAVAFSIPEDLVSLSSGTARFLFPVEDPCTSWDHAFVVTVYDALDTPSVSLSFPIRASGTGQLLEGALPVDLGTIEPVTVTCGAIDTNDDTDRIRFSVASDRRLRLSLSWNSNADVDYSLFENGVDWGAAVSVVQPEVFERPFVAGAIYEVEIYKVPGLPSPNLYQLLILPAP